MFYNNINPVLLEFGPFQVRYYGMFFVLGILFTYWLLGRLLKEKSIKLGKDGLPTLMLYLIVGVLLGSRLLSVLSDWQYYLAHPGHIFMWWNGGMAFHGGLMGAIIALLLFSRKKKVSFYALADMIIIPVCVALALGRIGNFTNGEFYGKASILPWAVQFSGVEGFRHPVQIYEAISMLALFVLLLWLRKKKLPSGSVFLSFIVLYGTLRIWLEFYKDLPPLLFGLTWGQLFSIPMIIMGGLMLASLCRENFNKVIPNSTRMEGKK
jgi:phosphatidylglycerol---prolipoprotein diacylglyceryl transferase